MGRVSGRWEAALANWSPVRYLQGTERGLAQLAEWKAIAESPAPAVLGRPAMDTED